ncbi:MAG: N-6 DNA methylase [Pseudonocardia sp.]|nr:N-6 DNA methylase [Pseudonocardia sp.]
MLTTFLRWAPAPIRSVGALVRAVAPLCRLLRDEVVDQLDRERTRVKQGAPASAQPFIGLATDWRSLLFPGASDQQFADGYAQSVTFALLLARSRNVDFSDTSIHQVGRDLGESSALMGRALQLLTDHVKESFRVTLDTLLRVVTAVDWARVRAGRRDTYLYLYEEFLEAYDNDLRKSSGSYYTPLDVAQQMVRLTDDVVRTRLERTRGIGSSGVNVIDPAAGTGTFLLRILETVFERLSGPDGPGTGAAREAVADLATRLFGFELQMGPHAVSELRVNDVLTQMGVQVPAGGGVALHVTNTLDDPEQDIIPASSATIPISESARKAREIKATLPVTVVIGNPPYRERAISEGGWVARGDGTDNLMDDFRLDGNGRVEYVLHNLAWYFWRWATWKVFDEHAGSQQHGVVAFITTAAYLRGPGFAGMRSYLRRVCDEGWVIDLTPEGIQPDVATRVFPGVQQPLAIGIFLRRTIDSDPVPAKIRYRVVRGRRAEKFASLAAMNLDDGGWSDVRQTPDTAPFTPAHAVGWDDYPALSDLFPATSPGIKANRAWVFAPRAETLKRRWRDLVTEDDPAARAAKMKTTRDRSMTTAPQALDGSGDRKSMGTEAEDNCPAPILIGYRSFDRQYIIPDSRVIDYPRPPLWNASNCSTQMFAVEQHRHQIESGPGVIFSALIPDNDAFNNRGGRVLPAFHPDGRPTPTAAMRKAIASKIALANEGSVSGDGLVAYVAAVAAHPGYTARFAEQLATPGVRVPMTADPDLWREAVELGRTVLWLHTYGERCVDPAASRLRGAVEAIGDARVLNLDGIPVTEEGMPSTITHSADPQSRRVDEDGDNTLYIGGARFRPVSAAVWRYQVGGRRVVKSWFDYRRRNPAGRRSSPLDEVNATTWARTDTEELIRLLGVLHRLTELEAQQANLLDRICGGDLLSVQTLTAAGALPVRPADRVLSDMGAGLGSDVAPVSPPDSSSPA